MYDFIVLHFTVRSKIHFELIFFFYMVRGTISAALHSFVRFIFHLVSFSSYLMDFSLTFLLLWICWWWILPAFYAWEHLHFTFFKERFSLGIEFQFFSFNALKMSFYCLFMEQFWMKHLLIFWSLFLAYNVSFSLTAFKTISLLLVLSNLVMWRGFLYISFAWHSLSSLDLWPCSFY